MTIDNHSSDGPGDAAAPHAAGAAAEPRSLPRKGRLLVVDDEPQIGNTLRLLLDPDHEVIPVTNARDAFAKIASAGPFDIIFCDLMMPDVNGIEFYRALVKTAPELRDRLVFMTGGVFSQKTNDFLDTVSNTCIEKPFDIAALMRLIRERVASR
jgi:two-component system NtrC family sensor kinase